MKELRISGELADKLEPLLLAEFDCYLEQRRVYRQLVAENAHRGIAPPVKPRHTLVRLPKSTGHAKPAQPVRRAPLLVRTFAADIDMHGRTIEARVVPYDVPTLVRDKGGPAYTEVWRSGSFAEQAAATDGVATWLNFEHQRGVGGVIGNATELRDERDGLYGVFDVHRNPDGDKALSLVKDGLLRGISLEAFPIESATRHGIVERLRARLDAAALCRRPAYKTAQVLAVRGKR